MDNEARLRRIETLETYVNNLIDMLASGELETSFDGEAVKFADSIDIGRRIKLLRKEIGRLKAINSGSRQSQVRTTRIQVLGD